MIELLPPSGYDDLVAASLAKLETMSAADVLEAVGTLNTPDNPAGTPPIDLLNQCVEELKTSWKTRLTTPKEARETRETNTSRHPDGWYLPADDPTCTVVMGLRRISQTMIEGPPKKASTRAEVWNKTRVKDRLLTALPLGDYLGRLNLRPDNITDLQLGPSLL